LLSVTVGDLSHWPDTLERRLFSYFRNGIDRDTIILLDEADVFLHERDADDLERNSTVSNLVKSQEARICSWSG